jgi:hypothetical protein
VAAAGDEVLETEARAFGRYLVGRVPPPELIARYVAASRTLFPESGDARDRALLGFVRRHPWSARYLDAATALLRPAAVLRSKVLVLGAILEASPTFADEFLPRHVGLPGLVLRVIGNGIVAVLSALLGALLYAAVARSRA